MITLYEVDGESFFCFPNWHLHQRIQTKKSKFPPPPWPTVNHRELPPEIETETEIETEEETEVYSGEEPASPPLVILLPLNDGTEYPVSYAEYAEFVELYQAVDVLQQLKEDLQAGGEWQTMAKIANAICHIAKMARTRTKTRTRTREYITRARRASPLPPLKKSADTVFRGGIALIYSALPQTGAKQKTARAEEVRSKPEARGSKPEVRGNGKQERE